MRIRARARKTALVPSSFFRTFLVGTSVVPACVAGAGAVALLDACGSMGSAAFGDGGYASYDHDTGVDTGRVGIGRGHRDATLRDAAADRGSARESSSDAVARVDASRDATPGDVSTGDARDATVQDGAGREASGDGALVVARDASGG
jgi:hypothetical protein